MAAETIARLKARCGTGFRIVAGAAELSLVAKMPPALPAVYVVLAEESAAPNERISGPLLQEVEADLALVLYAGSAADSRGETAMLSIDALAQTLKAALLGWSPNETTHAPLEYIGAETIKARDGLVQRELRFGTSYHLTEAP